MLNQRDVQALARVAGPGVCVVGIGNGKKLWIDLAGKACKERMTTSELDYITCGKLPGLSSSHATPPVSLQVRELNQLSLLTWLAATQRLGAPRLCLGRQKKAD